MAAGAADATHQYQRMLSLNVVVSDGALILELLAAKEQPLRVGGRAILVLDHRFDIRDQVVGSNIEGECAARE